VPRKDVLLAFVAANTDIVARDPSIVEVQAHVTRHVPGASVAVNMAIVVPDPITAGRVAVAAPQEAAGRATPLAVRASAAPSMATAVQGQSTAEEQEVPQEPAEDVREKRPILARRPTTTPDWARAGERIRIQILSPL